MTSPKVVDDLHGAALLQQRLSDPRVAEGLARLLDRIDSVSFAVEAVEGLVARGDVIADSVADAVNEFKQVDSRWSVLIKQTPELMETGARLAVASRGIDVEEVQRSHLLERISQPETLALINSLLDRLPLITFLAESMEELLKRGEVITDNVTEIVQELKRSEVQFDFSKAKALLEQLPKLQAMSEQILQSRLAGEDLPKAIEASANLVDSGMLDEKVLSTLGRVSRQVVDGYLKVSAQPVPPLGGIWALMRALKDPDVQKTVGFGLAFAKEFAKNLK